MDHVNRVPSVRRAHYRRSARAIQTYPNKPVAVIVGFQRAHVDIVRVSRGKVERDLGPSVFWSTIGQGRQQHIADIAKASPDGYTLLISVSATCGHPGITGSFPYDPVRDFAPSPRSNDPEF